MSLYAIGDLHLSLGTDKPMDIFGGRWENYVSKISEGFSGLNQEDVCVLCGDLTWAMNLDSAEKDFVFIHGLPGKKIILKGNHDYWWNTASKAYACFDKWGTDSIKILHNCCYEYGDNVAICGTRGWFFEEETGSEHDKKIMLREIGRLETSLKAAGSREKMVFLHYPPIFGNYVCEYILELFDKYSVCLCCSGHIHGKGLSQIFEGVHGKTKFLTVSADKLGFRPEKIL